MGYLKGKSALMMCALHANQKYKFGNRRFWAEGYERNVFRVVAARLAKRVERNSVFAILIARPPSRHRSSGFFRATLRHQ